MGEKKKANAARKKDSQFIIRISKEERAAFVDLCEELDTSAAREIRHFIRRFVARHRDNAGEVAGTGTPPELDH